MKKVLVSLLVIILIVAVGTGGWYLWDSLQKEKNKNEELENKIAKLLEENTSELNEKVESNKNIQNGKNDSQDLINNKEDQYTYNKLQGRYEASSTENDWGCYMLELNSKGQFRYKWCPNTAENYMGYYTIEGNKITLYCVTSHANDPGVSLINKVMEVSVDSNGNIKENEYAKGILQKKSNNNTLDVDFVNEIRAALKTGFLCAE